MKPRIVILSTFLTPFRSGAEACAEEVAGQLQDKFTITIITAKLSSKLPRRDKLANGVRIQRIGIGQPIDKWLYPFLAPFAVREFHPHIIHAVLETMAGAALMGCAWTYASAIRILTLQTTNRTFLKGMIIRSAHFVTCISTALKKIATSLGRDDAIHIPNGIDLQAIERANAQIKKIPGRVLFVGRLEPMKGIDLLIRAFATMVEHIPERPELHLKIVGKGSQQRKLMALAKEVHMEDRIIFAGAIPPPRIWDEYAAAEIFCGLSRSEALGNVFIEAQAAGCAVIGTNVGGIPDIITYGKTGLLIPPDDLPAACAALGDVMTKPNEVTTLSEGAKENAKSYDWSLIADRYANVYAHALGQETML